VADGAMHSIDIMSLFDFDAMEVTQLPFCPFLLHHFLNFFKSKIVSWHHEIKFHAHFQKLHSFIVFLFPIECKGMRKLFC